MVRAVGVVATQTVVTRWRMLPEERSAFVGVAGVASFVDGIGLEQGLRSGAVRIVAIRAAHLTLGNRHVGPLREIRPLLLVARIAGFVDTLLFQQSGGGILHHRIVAVAAAQLMRRVGGAFPEHLRAALVARAAHLILQRDRGAPLFREADERDAVLGVVGIVAVLGTRAVAGLATELFLFVFRIQAKHIRMNRMGKLVVRRFVTRDARGLADVSRAFIQGRRHLGTRGAGENARQREPHGENADREAQSRKSKETLGAH